MVIALAMMGIVFGAIVPQFTVIRNSWDSKQGAAESLQNGRVLIDHLNYNLAKAVKRLQEQNSAFGTAQAGMSKQMRDEFGRLDKEREDTFHQAELSRFDDLMDGMDEDLFGGEKDLTEETEGRRKAVWDAFKQIERSQPPPESKGNRQVKPPSMEVLVRGAAMYAFGDEMLKAQRKSIHRDIHEQGRGRRPSPGKSKVISPSSQPKKPQTIHEEAQEIASSPEVTSLYDRHVEESGNAPQ